MKLPSNKHVSPVRALISAFFCIVAFFAEAGEYTDLEYIDILGPYGYFDTGIRATNNFEAEVDFMPYFKGEAGFLIARTQTATLFPCYTRGNGRLCRTGTDSRASLLEEFALPAQMKRQVLKTRYAGDFEGYWLDNMLLYSGNTAEEIDLGINFSAFGRPGWSSSNDKAYRCYGLKIWNCDASGERRTLVRDFRPCTTGGRLAFRDAVSDAFFFPNNPNSWSAPTAENGGVPVRFFSYLDLYGSYIDIDVQAKSGLEAEADMEWKAVPSDACFLGARSGNTRFYLIYDYPSRWNIGYGSNYNSSSAPAANTRYSVVSHLDAGEQWCKVNGETVITQTVAGTLDTGRNLFLGSMNYNGNPAYASSTRIYSLIIRRKNDDGEWEKIRDLHPAVIAWTRGMFDSVEGRFFTVTGDQCAIGEEIPGDIEPEYLEFIDSDASGFADTGITGATGLEAELDLSLLEIAGSGDQGILASRGNNGSGRFYMISIYPHKWNLGYVNNYQEETSTIPHNGRHVVRSRCFMGDQELSVDGEVKVSLSSDSLVDTEQSLILFSYNTDYKKAGNGAVRFFGGKIWRRDEAGGTNVLVRDFRPARCGSRAALFDEVSRKFFFNGGNATGAFIPGPRLSKRPRPCEYVESDGANHVDLEITARSGLEVKAKLMMTEVPYDACIIGARHPGDNRFYMIYNYPSKWSLGYGDNNISDSTPEAGKLYRVESRLAAGEQWCKVNGETVVTGTSPAEYDLGIPLSLFACNYASSSVSYNSMARIYSLTIRALNTESGEWEVVRDLRPGVRDGIACLYDNLDGKCYYPFQLLGGINAHPLKYGPLKPVGTQIRIW